MKRFFLIMMVFLLALCLMPLAAASPGEPFNPAGVGGFDFMFPGLQADFSEGVSTPIGGVSGFLPVQYLPAFSENVCLNINTENQICYLGPSLTIMEAAPEVTGTTTFHMRT